jgi:predicted acyltransferase
MITTQNETERIRSIDIFRGLTIGLMIIVNNQGDWSHVYPVFRHAAWHGWSGADVVFPFFLFIMGVSISYSFSSGLRLTMGKPFLMGKILKRTLILIALGFLLNFIPEFNIQTVRIPGVLQRIGLCYCFGAISFLFLTGRGRWIATISILALYGFMLKYVTPAGIGEGTLEPDGNLCHIVDRALFAGHTYQHALVAGFDPEGLPGTLPAVASTIGGILTGDVMRRKGTVRKKCVILGAAALMCIGAGLLLDRWIPINKNLWTPSYAVFMTGLALGLMAFLWWFVDVKGAVRGGLPFTVLGLNAIAAYVLSSAAGKIMVHVKVLQEGGAAVTVKALVYQGLFAGWLSPFHASTAYSLAFLAFWTAVMYLLYRKNILIKI